MEPSGIPDFHLRGLTLPFCGPTWSYPPEGVWKTLHRRIGEKDGKWREKG
jgi:hypothetical protein